MGGLPDLTGSGDHLVVREGDRIVAAPPEDQAVALTYPGFEDKGPVIDGYRLTVLTSKVGYRPGEPVRVVHICESMVPNRPLYVMGPKPIFGEYVDNGLATEPPPEGDNPLAPPSYDGRVLNGPGIDSNYEITQYQFQDPGSHTIQWRLGPYVSNLVTIEVLPHGGLG